MRSLSALASPLPPWVIWITAIGLAGCGGPPSSEVPSAEGPAAAAPSDTCGEATACTSQCEAGDAASCETLGRMHETGEGASQDYQRAAAAYQQACDGGRNEACAHLAMMYDIGLAVQEDAAKANELYRRACQGGNRWACNRSEQLGAAQPTP